MILFTEKYSYINVLHGQFKPTFSVQHLGEFRWLSDSGIWQLRFMGRNKERYTDLLDEAEKCTIIGMLSKLNNIGLGYTSNWKSAWEDIIGQRSWTDNEIDSMPVIGQ